MKGINIDVSSEVILLKLVVAHVKVKSTTP
jgi:hypothetical protein